MIVSANINRVRKLIAKVKSKNKIIGFVPTMGALHQGHLSLVKKAKKECDFTVASIFVNPAQFGPKEDYRKYPRTFKNDKELLEKEGINLIFRPTVKAMYPLGFSTYVQEAILSEVLCGKCRPGHFRGVCTVVAKLFNVVTPDIVYLGQKDYQQAEIIKKMVKDLNLPIIIRTLPTAREKDGLAMSSRNKYLSNQERKDATSLYCALSLAKKLIQQGQHNPKIVINEMRRLILSRNTAKIDYVKIVDANTLRDLKKIEGKTLVVLAVFVGKTRLIDNIVLNAR